MLSFDCHLGVGARATTGQLGNGSSKLIINGNNLYTWQIIKTNNNNN